MMHPCIFHIGMPKTGTSSIQESLYYGLQDPNFRYVDLGQGQINVCRALVTLFCDAPEKYHYHQQLNLSVEDVNRSRQSLQWKLQQTLEKAKTLGQTVILSAEEGWRMKKHELLRLRDFLAADDFGVKVVAYLRSWKPWLESIFQQEVKMGIGAELILPTAVDDLAYCNHVQILEDVFGTDRVEIYLYQPQSFPDGCVVKDSCHRLGIRFDPHQIHRANDSLTLPAIQLLYTYRKLRPAFGTGRQALFTDWILRRRLTELSGTAIRFHSSLVEPVVQALADQILWLEQRLGYRFDADIRRDDKTACIRHESDLFRYDRDSLEWLAAATGQWVRDDPQIVADQMHRLRYHPTMSSVTMQLYEIGRAKLKSSIKTFRQERLPIYRSMVGTAQSSPDTSRVESADRMLEE